MIRDRCFSFALLLTVTLFVRPLEADEPRRVLLVGQGPDGHPPGTHEFMAGVRIMEHLLKPIENIEVTTTKADEPWPSGPQMLDKADAVVLYVSEGAKWMEADSARLAALERLAVRGGGIVALHWAVGAKDPQYIPVSLRFLGGCHGGPDRHYTKIQTSLWVADPRHPISYGIGDFELYDEFYYQLKFVRPEGTVHPLLQATIDGKRETVAWCWNRPDGGRSFGFSALHVHDNWKLEAYRRLVLQAILWTLGREIPQQGLPVDCPEQVLTLP